VDLEAFEKAMSKKFYLRSEPLPVPDSEHFTQAVMELLGVDAESVSVRVRDAGVEAQRELLRRMIEPVRAMAEKLAEAPKEGHDVPIFRDTLVENVRAIAELAPKLNLGGDTQLDAFALEIRHKLAGAVTTPAQLRSDAELRAIVAKEAGDMAAKMAAYRF
jgi:hypothetical protein